MLAGQGHRHAFDCEFGYSCMGYELAGGWGAAMADPHREVSSWSATVAT
ncbi:MAG: thiamine pyrophosphate-dependent enzyme [Geminicoccaceae bacterium]